LQPLLLDDRFLGPAAVFLVREYRVLAYAQFLEAYKRCLRLIDSRCAFTRVLT
jgi:hypothetical protein